MGLAEAPTIVGMQTLCPTSVGSWVRVAPGRNTGPPESYGGPALVEAIALRPQPV